MKSSEGSEGSEGSGFRNLEDSKVACSTIREIFNTREAESASRNDQYTRSLQPEGKDFACLLVPPPFRKTAVYVDQNVGEWISIFMFNLQT